MWGLIRTGGAAIGIAASVGAAGLRAETLGFPTLFNSYGVPGVIDMPTALSAPDGMLTVTFRDSRNARNRLERAAELFELSPAQVRLAGLILEGFDLPQIADRLAISPNTASSQPSRSPAGS